MVRFYGINSNGWRIACKLFEFILPAVRRGHQCIFGINHFLFYDVFVTFHMERRYEFIAIWNGGFVTPDLPALALT